MKNTGKLYWKNGGGVSVVILLAILALVGFSVFKAVPVIREERILNIEKNIAQMTVSFEKQVMQIEMSPIKVLADYSELLDNPDSLYVLCEHLAKCNPIFIGASVICSGEFLSEGENIPTVVLSGEKSTDYSVDRLDISDYVKWEDVTSFFEDNSERWYYFGRITRFVFLDEPAAPIIITLRKHAKGKYDGFAILYIPISALTCIIHTLP